jgi:hypothetical protein
MRGVGGVLILERVGDGYSELNWGDCIRVGVWNGVLIPLHTQLLEKIWTTILSMTACQVLAWRLYNQGKSNKSLPESTSSRTIIDRQTHDGS